MADEDAQTFATKVKALRLRYGYSQQQMGHLLGLTTEGYGKWERGVSRPGLVKLILLHERFDVAWDDIMPDRVESVPIRALPTQQRRTRRKGGE